MNPQKKIEFITGKVRQLQTAILHCHSNCLLKFPTSLAKTVHTDETGCVWILVKRPSQFLHEFDRSFHVALNYYKKGTPFYLNMLGIARMIIDPEEINNLPPDILKEAYSNKNLLLCIQIIEASYFENESTHLSGFMQRCKRTISSLFFHTDNHHYLIQEERNVA